MIPDAASAGAPRLGSWARVGDHVGLVAAVDGGEVAVFDPGERRSVRAPLADVEVVPSGAVTVTVTVNVPLPHGVGEPELRRWVASLVDDAVRERAVAALSESGLDLGAALPGAELSVRRMEGGGAVCLCGTLTDAPEGSALPCPACGREAVAAPPTTG